MRGLEHPDTLRVRGHLASQTGRAGAAAAARDQFDVLLPIAVRVSGPGHPGVLTVRSYLASWTGEAAPRSRPEVSTQRFCPPMNGSSAPSTRLPWLSVIISHPGQGGLEDRLLPATNFAALLTIRERVLVPVILLLYPPELISLSGLAKQGRGAPDVN